MGEKITTPPEERARRLSAVVKKLSGEASPVLGADTQDEKSGQARRDLRARNKRLLEGALKNPGLQRLMNDKPVFYERNETEGTSYFIEEEFRHLLSTPEITELLKNPTTYIEKHLEPVDRGDHSMESLPGETVAEYAAKPYDISRVKRMQVGKEALLIKRVDLEKVNSELEEYEVAKKARSGGVPTPRTVGYIKDAGNTYLLFEYIPNSIDLNEFWMQYHAVAESSGDVGMHGRLNIPLFSGTDRSITILSDDDRYNEEKKRAEKWKLAVHYLEAIDDEIDGFMEISHPEHWSEEYRNKMQGIYGFPVPFPELKAKDISDFLERVSSIKKWGLEAEVERILGLDITAVQITKNSFKEFEDLIARIQANLGGRTLTEVLREERRKSSENAQRGFEKWGPVIEREGWGASVTVAYEKLRQTVEAKCEALGIKHKDFNMRNILIKMDADKKKLLPDENGDAQFYVIDWEQK